MRSNRFAVYSWSFLGYALLTILWGAYVRASGSGAGCGAHWPLCNGVVIPVSAQTATLIEFTHRVMSGLTVLFAAVLVVWAWRAFPRGSRIRLGAGLVGLFTLTEALVGAGLVLFELVAKNDSLVRAASVAVHLVNTLLLVGSITLTAWWASGGNAIELRRNAAAARMLLIALALVMLLSATGAVTALGDTLFPSTSLAQGMQQDFSPTAHFLLRLRIYHPLLAVVTGAFCLFTAGWTQRNNSSPSIRAYSAALTTAVLLQIGLGLLNIYLLAPIWMQMLHLLVSDLVWISLVLLAVSALSAPAAASETPQTVSAHQV
ncbi:MAG TPA: COX15/CtaA family protein [Anaerolineaceae bacterium]